MDVAAEEVLGLILFDEIAHRGGPGVQAGTNAVELGFKRRRVADEDERLQFGEPLEALGELRFGVLPRSVERRGSGVAKPGDLPAADGDVTLVKIVQSVARAHRGGLFGGFVIAGQDVNFVAAGAHHLAASIEAFAPTDLITGGDVVIGIHAEQAFERFPIVVNIGEDLQLQFRDGSSSFAVGAHGTCDQPKSAYQKREHYKGFEEAGGTKVDVQVRDDAGDDE